MPTADPPLTAREAHRMPSVSLRELAATLAPGTRLLGLDLGAKTVGLAISDSALRVASPLETLRRGKFTQDAAALRRLCGERAVGGLVIGLPINMDGSEGPRAQSTRAFARNLAKQTALPIALWDERLSTAAVERALIEADVSRAKRAKVIDQHAAAFILQGALDCLARIATPPA
jgi:putative Holliday junction resolvase